jgi:hypothetical protein
MAAAAILASAVLGVHRVHAEPDSESTDAKISAAKAASHAGVESWDTESVAAWLVLRGLPAEVVREAREADVDGATLLELTHEGWAELGCAPPLIKGAWGFGYSRARTWHPPAQNQIVLFMWCQTRGIIENVCVLWVFHQ